MLLNIKGGLVGEEDSQIAVRLIGSSQAVDGSGGGVINEFRASPVNAVVSALYAPDFP